ncbi:MAG TPA: hypothetical protein VJ550_03550 [Geomonas sp.]|nr:hypothetical protein [Geomonas sp.]
MTDLLTAPFSIFAIIAVFAVVSAWLANYLGNASAARMEEAQRLRRKK